MSKIITVGHAKYKVLSDKGDMLELRSLYSGVVREAEKVFLRFGYCTRPEYLCGFLLHEIILGFDEDFVCVPVKLWWTDIIDLIINNKVTLRLVTSKNWRVMLLGLQEIQRIFGDLESVEQTSHDCWNVVCGGITVVYHPLSLLDEDYPVNQAIKLESILETDYRVVNDNPIEKFGIKYKLCYTFDNGNKLAVRVERDMLILTQKQWKKFIEFVYFSLGRKFYNNGVVYYYSEGKLIKYDCKGEE